MKTIYLLALFTLFFSSCIVNRPTSHVPIMPNEPMFDNRLQGNLSGGIGFDHIEGQAAFSVSKNFGITGGFYAGSKGIKQYELGSNVFLPLQKNPKLFYSFSAGLGNGTFKGKYDIVNGAISGKTWCEVDNSFNTKYLQSSLYHRFNSASGVFKIGVGLKYEIVNFSRFNISYHSSSGLSANTFAFFYSADPQRINIFTPFLTVLYENNNTPFTTQLQLGNRVVKNGFNARRINANGSGSGEDILAGKIHPLFGRHMLNLTIGLRIR